MYKIKTRWLFAVISMAFFCFENVFATTNAQQRRRAVVSQQDPNNRERRRSLRMPEKPPSPSSTKPNETPKNVFIANIPARDLKKVVEMNTDGDLKINDSLSSEKILSLDPKLRREWDTKCKASDQEPSHFQLAPESLAQQLPSPTIALSQMKNFELSDWDKGSIAIFTADSPAEKFANFLGRAASSSWGLIDSNDFGEINKTYIAIAAQKDKIKMAWEKTISPIGLSNPEMAEKELRLSLEQLHTQRLNLIEKMQPYLTNFFLGPPKPLDANEKKSNSQSKDSRTIVQSRRTVFNDGRLTTEVPLPIQFECRQKAVPAPSSGENSTLPGAR